MRDTAASLKHGALTRQGKTRIARVVRTPGSLQAVPAVLGLLCVEDELDGLIAMLCLKIGTDAIRADEALAATVRELLPLLHARVEPEHAAPV